MIRWIVIAALAGIVLALLGAAWYVYLIVALSSAITLLVALLYMAMRWP